MNIKKVASVFIPLVVLIFILSACQATETEPQATETEPQATETEPQTTETEPQATETAGEADVVIQVSADNFTFSEEVITVQKGQLVRIELAVTEGFHDLVIDEFNAATAQVNAGNSTSVEFVADQAGEFEYYCSVGSHRAMGMIGTLIVQD